MNGTVLMILETWQTGGTEQYVAQLARFLRKRGWLVTAAVLRGMDRRAAETMCEGLELVSLGESRAGSLLELRRLVRRIRPDVCHCHLYSTLLPATLVLRALRVRRLVTTLHMPVDDWSWRHRWAWRIAARLADRAVCNSPAVARSIGRAAAAVIPPPFTAASEQSESRDAEDVFTVCGCGRLSPEKDWPTLLRAFAEFRHAVEGPVRLVHLGGGRLEPQIRQLVGELRLDDAVDLRGDVERQAVFETLRGADVFVLPSRFEGLGMAALEAMQCGVPTITSDFPASYDFLQDGATGHRFPRGDWLKLSDLLVWHFHHPDESRAIGKRGRESVLDQFSEANTFGRYPAVYGLDEHLSPEEVMDSVALKGGL